MHRVKSLQAFLIIMSALIIGVLAGCISRMEEVEIKDYGKQQIGKNLYLKKLVLNSNDRVYILVDANDKLVSTNVGTDYTVSSGKSSRTESTTLIH